MLRWLVTGLSDAYTNRHSLKLFHVNSAMERSECSEYSVLEIMSNFKSNAINYGPSKFNIFFSNEFTDDPAHS